MTDVTKVMRDTEIVTLTSVLEMLNETPSMAKLFIKQRLDELKEEENARNKIGVISTNY